MRPVKRPFCKRVGGLDFILKLMALLVAWLILELWTREEGYYDRLPAKSYFEWDLYFHTVNGYIFVLSGQLLLYFIGEIPKLIVQRVILLYGGGLWLICGIVGLINFFWLMEPMQYKMLIIALLCFFPAFCLIWDYLWQEEYFKPQPELEDKTAAETPSKTSTKTPTDSTITPTTLSNSEMD